MPEERSEEANDRLFEQQEAWLRGGPLVAARKAKGRHPNPLDDDPRVALLQRDMLLVEKALPPSAFSEGWDPGAWKEAVRSCREPADFRDRLASLELAVQDTFFSPHFARVPLLVQGAWLATGTSPNPTLSAL